MFLSYHHDNKTNVSINDSITIHRKNHMKKPTQNTHKLTTSANLQLESNSIRLFILNLYHSQTAPRQILPSGTNVAV